jgi:hypothetical protein
MSQIRKENLAKDAYKDPKNAEAIRKFESLQVQGGRVIIKAHPPKQPQAFLPMWRSYSRIT